MSKPVHDVAFIGLGRMGGAMARNILRAGFSLTVFNRSPEKMLPFLEAGAKGASSPAEAAGGADVVFTSLMDDRSVLATVCGEGGVLAGLRPRAVHVGTTTVSARCTREVAAAHAAHGSEYVAAPVVGRPHVADAGQLVTFVAGPPDAIVRCEPVLSSYAPAMLRVGSAPEIASSLKLAVNYTLGAAVDLMGQVLAFGEKTGIDPQHLQVVLGTIFAHPGLQEYATRMRERRYEDVAFGLGSWLKDVELFLDASTEARAPLPFANVLRDRALTAIAHGLGDLDSSATYEMTRMNDGLAHRSRRS